MSDCDIVDPLRNAHWDALVVSHPQANFFHGTAWARVLIASYGFTPLYLSSQAGDRLTGCLALMEAKSQWFGLRGVSLPFTDLCPVLGTTLMPVETLIQEGIRLGVRRHWKYLELRIGQKPDAPGMTVPSQQHYGHELDLSAPTERIFQKFDASVQRAVRKAEKSGVSAEISHELPALQEFYLLHCLTRKKHGLPPQSLAFFRQIHAHVLTANLGFVVLAKQRSRPLAGAVIFRFGSQAVYKYAASDPKFLHLRGNNLVLWTVIQNLKNLGVDRLHLGRTSFHDEGLRRFKKGWGAREETLNYYKFDFGKSQYVKDLDRSRGWYNAVFSRLPMPLLRGFGAYCYRHLV